LGGEKLRHEVEFIEKSINALPEKDYEVMLAVFIDKKSVRGLAKSLFLSHNGLRKRIEKITKALMTVYESLFC